MELFTSALYLCYKIKIFSYFVNFCTVIYCIYLFFLIFFDFTQILFFYFYLALVRCSGSIPRREANYSPFSELLPFFQFLPQPQQPMQIPLLSKSFWKRDNNYWARLQFKLTQSMPSSLPNNAVVETDHTYENWSMNAGLTVGKYAYFD